MATVVDAIYDRLTATLGPLVPVLRPEQIELPKQGRTPGQPGGIPGYLAQHPGGYVQIEQPVPISSDGLAGTFWVTVAALHLNPALLDPLSWRVYRALAGWPWAPGPYREITPAQPEQLQGGVWMVRRTFEAKTLDSMTVG